MNFIELTSANGYKFFINPKMIGHLYPRTHSQNNKIIGTTVGITTHNNGGFEVIETPQEIIKLIDKAK